MKLEKDAADSIFRWHETRMERKQTTDGSLLLYTQRRDRCIEKVRPVRRARAARFGIWVVLVLVMMLMVDGVVLRMAMVLVLVMNGPKAFPLQLPLPSELLPTFVTFIVDWRLLNVHGGIGRGSIPIPLRRGFRSTAILVMP